MSKRVYILGLKRRGDEHYGLTTWMGDSPLYYATYKENPSYWDKSVLVEPLGIYKTESEAKESGEPYNYMGFGWLSDSTTGKLIKEQC